MFKYIQRLAIFAVTFLVLSGNAALADPPTPKLLCLSVQDNGSILAKWEITGTGTFDGFRLYFRLSNINPPPPFQEIDIPANEFSRIIPVNNANDEQYEVFIITYDETAIAQSQTLKTTKIDVYPQSGSNGGVAIVEWGVMNNTTSNVYRSIDGINFTLLGQTSTNNYTNIIEGICDPTDLYYYVEFTSDNCTFRSMTSSVSEMSDNTAPEDPIFEYVTINEDGYAVLNWAPVNASDIAGYQIEVKTGFTYEEHASTGIVNSFTDDLVGNLYFKNPCDTIVSYVLKAVDQCGNTSAQNVYAPTSIHNTIWFRVDLETNCNRKATFTWNRYNNMNPPVSSYQIWRSQNNSVEIVGTINVDGSGPEEFTFTDPEILKSGEQYTYHISTKSEGSDKSSSSCRVDVVPDPELLNAFDLDNVTVFNNEFIQLIGNGEPAEFINEVAIYRSNTSAVDLKPLMNSSWDSPGMIIPETSANVNDSAYYYQIVALDACGFPMDSSTIFRSIYLQLEDMGEGNVRLNWNAFEGWDDNSFDYAIFRLTDGMIDAGFPWYDTALVYNDVDPGPQTGRITYYVEATRDDEVKSRSNEVLLPGEAEIALPNAFKPDSDYEINRIFLPIVKNVEPSSYLFTIYNRWGQLVFETNDPSQGWDGSRNGSISPGGIYAYLVTYSDYNGNTFQQRGAVTLLR